MSAIEAKMRGGMKQRNTGKGSAIRYYTTFQNTVADVLAARGWEEVDDDSTGWDFVWADREWVYSGTLRFYVKDISRNTAILHSIAAN